MRTTAALLALVTFASVARADDLHLRDQPTVGEKVEKHLGIALLIASGIMAATDSVIGPASLLGGLCDNSCDSDAAADRRTDAAVIGLAVSSAVTAAIGIPLLVAGTNAEKRQQLHVGVAPMIGGGVAASFGMRF